MIISKELIEKTLQTCKGGTAIWNHCERCDLSEYESKGWDVYKNPNGYDRGAWTAIAASDLIKMGGHDERWFGWGPEDIFFHDQIQSAGIVVQETKFPLLHINHPKRNQLWGCPVHTDRHVEYEELKKHAKPANYLTDPLCPNWNNTISFLTNTFCTKTCPQCSQLEFRQAFPDYEASVDEIDLCFNAIEGSGRQFDRLMLWGGEPLYWNNLEYGLQKFSQAQNIGKVIVVTTIPDRELFEKARKGTNSFIVSKIESNTEDVQWVKKIDGLDLTVWNQLTHRVKPQPGQYFEKGGCLCKDGVTFFNGRVYSCPNTLDVNLLHNGLSDDVVKNPNYSEPITNTFVDLLRGKTFGQLDCCAGCVSCTSVHKILGSTRNHPS